MEDREVIYLNLYMASGFRDFVGEYLKDLAKEISRAYTSLLMR
ncbi:MAG: hypothetical protein N3G77_07915 [Nitrososphaeria archaeon]|nr:hypothetical protein [Nitrososphaeria archaeon]MDW7987063.1 hypothetical protein [Nitrososphaerota archaeon]